MVKERDLSIDVMRGLAAYMVVFTHIIQLYGDNSNNIINNVMLSLQIPLFMMVSGYTTKYAKRITNWSELKQTLFKRSRLLLLPWFMWSVILYAVHDSNVPLLEHLEYVAFHMEGAYWFLFSLWCIDIAFILSDYSKILLPKRNVSVVKLLLFGFVLVIYLMIGAIMGVSFMGVKFTLYYSLFFILGYLLSKEKIEGLLLGDNRVVNSIIGMFAVLFFILTSKMNVFDIPDTPFYILYRLVISGMGCLIVFYTVKRCTWHPSDYITKNILWGGIKSLEIYVVHYLLLRIFMEVSSLRINTFPSMIETILYFLVVIVVTRIIIVVIDKNPFSRLYLFGKK